MHPLNNSGPLLAHKTEKLLAPLQFRGGRGWVRPTPPPVLGGVNHPLRLPIQLWPLGKLKRQKTQFFLKNCGAARWKMNKNAPFLTFEPAAQF